MKVVIPSEVLPWTASEVIPGTSHIRSRRVSGVEHGFGKGDSAVAPGHLFCDGGVSEGHTASVLALQ